MPGLDHFRAHQRSRVTLAAQMSGLQSGEVFSCLLLDIGMGGAQVSCQSSIPEGAVGNICLSAPLLWEPLVLPIRVAWARQESDERSILGLQFQPQTGVQLLILADLLRVHDAY